MNDPRHPVQPAPAAPATPRTAPAAPAQQTMPRPAPGLGQASHVRPTGAPAPQQAPRAAHAPQPHAPHPTPAHAPQPARPLNAAPPPLPGQNIPRPGGGSKVINPAASQRQPAEEEAIALVEDDEDAGGDSLAPAPAVSKIRAFSDAGHKKHDYKRALKEGGPGICRVRTFHAKLSDQGLEYLDDAINVWLDQHPEINVKLVTSNVGMFDGKFKDLALIMNVWY